MKVIAINGSPHKNGNTSHVLGTMAEVLRKEGIEVEILDIGGQNIHGCIGCGHCWTSEENLCVFKDDVVNEAAKKMRTADGYILASPTYYAGIAGTMKAFLDRVFYTSSYYFRYKAATSVTVVRRSGGVDALHQLNNYLMLAETVRPPSQYWLTIYGDEKGEVLKDAEGMQTARKNAAAMAWLMKTIEAGKENIPVPQDEERIMMSFIRE